MNVDDQWNRGSRGRCEPAIKNTIHDHFRRVGDTNFYLQTANLRLIYGVSTDSDSSALKEREGGYQLYMHAHTQMGPSDSGTDGQVKGGKHVRDMYSIIQKSERAKSGFRLPIIRFWQNL